jgi:hypothetical protein
MSRALGGWLGIFGSLLLLMESESGRAASINQLGATNYTVTSGPVACAGGVCTATLEAPGTVSFGAAFNSNDTSPSVTELQTALAAVPGLISFYGRSLDSIRFKPITSSASNNGTDGAAIFAWDTQASARFPANLQWDQWITGTFNTMLNDSPPGTAKDLGNTMRVTFPAAALVGSPLYDIFVRDDPNAFATPHPDSSRPSEPNAVVPTRNWEAFYLVPPAKTTGNQANRVPAWGGTDGVQWGGTDGAQWGGTWGGTTPAVPGSNMVAGTPGAVSPSWPQPWPAER